MLGSPQIVDEASARIVAAAVTKVVRPRVPPAERPACDDPTLRRPPAVRA